MSVHEAVRGLVPSPVRRLFSASILQRQAERRRREGDALRAPGLGIEHVRNARLLPDRRHLLEHLPRGGVVAELGVDEGRFSEQVLALTSPARLHLVDAWGSDRYGDPKASAVQERFRDRIADGTVVVHRGLSTDVLPRFDDGMLDWVYIDTNHAYETTARELRLCEQKVKPGGLIAGHDYVTGNWIDDVRYGVVEAVNEFCVKRGWEFVYLTCETHRHVSFALRRMPAETPIDAA